MQLATKVGADSPTALLTRVVGKPLMAKLSVGCVSVLGGSVSLCLDSRLSLAMLH